MSFSNLAPLDLVFITISFLSGIIGYKRGAIKTLISFGGFIASFVMAWIFSSPLSKWLINTGMLNGLFEKLNIDALAQSLLDFSAQQNGLLSSPLGQAILGSGNTSTDQTIASVTNLITNGIVQTISFGLIVFGISILCWILQSIFSGINEIPVIGTFNRLLGLLLGLILGMSIVGIVLWLFSGINYYSGGTTNLPTYESSVLLKIGAPIILKFIGIQ
ncbi:CvpA family protein [Acetobacterium woodii]|uniref:Colicin V production protein n=1 Tax=Acetobacterium woodii (strain ATCC 29683 / DSM 1030 / JCM 2381 / KCTC 1655 / WB1) TaxID=931626 RepID=H6LCX3_ACEWD|nr:CvpA family protein [Acetobacterium woodii]AFA50278.1 hypothetical protein Awo_c35540 [Acetobacterium woodii DSM 1030]